MASVSVILPARNGANVIETQLQALAQQHTRHDVEIVVADHASTDRTREVAMGFADRFDRLVVHSAGDVAGVAAVRNSAVNVARGEYLAFCDCDDLAHPDWLEHLIEPLLSARCHTAGRLIYAHTSPPLTPAAFNNQATRPAEYMSYKRFADSCSLGVRRNDLISVNMFDPTYNRSSDVDLSWRLQLFGIPLVDAEHSLMAKLMPDGRLAQIRKLAGWAFQEPLLYRNHRAHGLQRRRLRTEARNITSALVSDARELTRKRVPSQTPIALAKAGGRLAGSYHWRVWYP
jgi:glycosyltransferase involved in cell wall biosynthesis